MCRTKASRHSGRCNSRPQSALEDYGDAASAIELLLGANEIELALGVISRGGETELERRPSEQLRIWVGRLASAVEAGRPWALVVTGVLDTRESRFTAALSALRLAAETLQREGDRDGLYQVLSITEWAEFWSGDCPASIGTCYSALDHAATDAQRLHTLLSLLSAALDMRRWDTVASASARADELLPRARPEEAARAQALRAHAAFYRGDMRTARELIQGCHDPRQTAAQRAATLNTHGMIDIALGDYEAAARHLQEAATTAEDFGHALASYMIEDNSRPSLRRVSRVTALPGAFRALAGDAELLHPQEPTLLAFALCHEGTVAATTRARPMRARSPRSTR